MFKMRNDVYTHCSKHGLKYHKQKELKTIALIHIWYKAFVKSVCIQSKAYKTVDLSRYRNNEQRFHHAKLVHE